MVDSLQKLKGPKEEAKNELTPAFERKKFDISYWNKIEDFKISELKPFQFL